MDGSDLIVFVMARGGSTRIPLKNIAMLGERTILSFTLEDVAEFQSAFPHSQCIVMTDHPAVEASVRSDNNRPHRLEIVKQTQHEASDLCELVGVNRVLQEKEAIGEIFKYVMMLGADNILRSPTLLADAYCRITQLTDHGLLVQSVIPVPLRYHPNRVITITADSNEARRWPSEAHALLSQDYPQCYVITGGVFIMRRTLIGIEGLKGHRRIHPLLTDQCQEIDTPEDLARARAMVNELLLATKHS